MFKCELFMNPYQMSNRDGGTPVLPNLGVSIKPSQFRS